MSRLQKQLKRNIEGKMMTKKSIHMNEYCFYLTIVGLAVSLQPGCDVDTEPVTISKTEATGLAPEPQSLLERGTVESPPGSNGKLYDAQRDLWLDDSDRDGTPDEVERAEGTDPTNADDYPGADAISLAFTGSCASSSFRLISYSNGGLCIHTDEQSATTYTRASNTCRTYHKTARVCTYEDLAFVYRWSSWDPTYNSLEMWIGNLVFDDLALKGNVNITYNSSSAWENFEHETDKGQNRQYWCCHTPD